MTDIDPTYFSELQGEISIGERFSQQAYIEDARQVLRTRLLIGEERDVCIRIDQQFDEEHRRLENIKVFENADNFFSSQSIIVQFMISLGRLAKIQKLRQRVRRIFIQGS